MVSSIVSGHERVELVEERAPAALMVVACGCINELGVMEDHQGAGAARLQRDRPQRFALRRRMPGPGEDQPFIRHDLAVDAAGLEILAIVAREADAVAAAGADIE